MSRKSPNLMSLAYSVEHWDPRTTSIMQPADDSPDRPLDPRMEAFMKHAHNNEELTVRSHLKAIDEARAKNAR